MLLQKIDLKLQLVRRPEIVGVEKADEISVGFLDASIARRGGAAVRLA